MLLDLRTPCEGGPSWRNVDATAAMQFDLQVLTLDKALLLISARFPCNEPWKFPILSRKSTRVVNHRSRSAILALEFGNNPTNISLRDPTLTL